MFIGLLPITPSRLLQKHARSKGTSLHQNYLASPVILPSPTPAQTSTKSAVTGRDPAPGTGLPRCPRYLPDMPSSLPRWIGISACVGYFLIPQRPSPNIGRVGIHNCPFGACSRFTRVTACQFAAALKAYMCPQSFSRKVSLTHCLGSYRDEPTISRAELSSAGILRPRGAPICCVSPPEMQIS